MNLKPETWEYIIVVVLCTTLVCAVLFLLVDPDPPSPDEALGVCLESCEPGNQDCVTRCCNNYVATVEANE